MDIRAIPKPGQIRGINRYLLQAMLMKLGCKVQFYGIVGDNYDQLASYSPGNARTGAYGQKG